MRFINVAFVVFAAFILSSEAIPSTQTIIAILKPTISSSSCDFYTQVERLFPCGPKGYIQKFADRYCREYMAIRPTFNDKEWSDGVRECLQRQLYQELIMNEKKSCGQIKKWGLDSHVGCYMNPIPAKPQVKACRLKADDMLKLRKIAKGECYQVAVLDQLCQIGFNCSGQYLQGSVQKDFKQYVEQQAFKALGATCKKIRQIDWVGDQVSEWYEANAEWFPNEIVDGLAAIGDWFCDLTDLVITTITE